MYLSELKFQSLFFLLSFYTFGNIMAERKDNTSIGDGMGDPFNPTISGAFATITIDEVNHRPSFAKFFFDNLSG
jgi:hypothetical protein